jgi:hypothetical protein
MTASVLPIRHDVMARIMNDPGAIGRAPVNPAACGLYPIYRSADRNYCPGCSRSHWLIGRLTAECAFCGHALPLQESAPASLPPVKIVRRSLADGWPVEGR